VPEQQDHRPGPELLVPGAAAVVFAASDLITRREDLALFRQRVRHDLVWPEIARRLQFLGRVRREPLTADTVCEERPEGLQLDFPGYLANAPRLAEILRGVDGHVGERRDPGLFTERN
jgi:hypothetical protein